MWRISELWYKWQVWCKVIFNFTFFDTSCMKSHLHQSLHFFFPSSYSCTPLITILIIVITCIFICIYSFMYICVMHIISMYSLLSLFRFCLLLCTYAWGWSLMIGQCMWNLSFEGTNSPFLNKHWPPEVLLRVGSCGVSPIHNGMSTGVIIMLDLVR